jgi:glycosyltransferase involved in cell wall biosynthesis
LVDGSICLSMIVKNEAPVIRRCLETVKPWINAWVIVDTGSIDGTQEIIREFMSDLPGELVERPWINFAHNRNEALALSRCRADYSLFIDADEQFIPYQNLVKLPCFKDCYFIRINEGLSFHHRAFLLKNSCKVSWTGVLHECLYSDDQLKEEMFLGGEILSLTEGGHRSQDPEKYLKDALILEGALKLDPYNHRYAFFLAQSYSNAKEYALALKAYERRAQMGGLEDEVFFSLFMIGVQQEALGWDPKICAESFLRAHKFRPFRKEPLYGIAVYYMKNNRFEEAYSVLNKCTQVPYPEDSIFVQTYINDYLIPYSLIDCCYRLKKYDECFIIGEKLLSNPSIPQDLYKKISFNLSVLKNKIPHLDIKL